MTQVTGKVVNRSQNGSRGAPVRQSPRACPERELYNLRRKTPDCNFISDNLIFVTGSMFFYKASGLEKCMLGKEEFLFRYGSKWKSHRTKIV